MDAGARTAAVVFSIAGAPSKHRCLISPIGSWASLPLDLLLEIFCRLESTAVIRCAAACRSWRRAIIGNAALLRPRSDRFLPSLLLGVFHGYPYYQPMWLRRTAGPLQSALPLTVATGYKEVVPSFIPSAAAAAAGKSRDECSEVVSSRDGFVLLRKTDWTSDLCLCNPMTGVCTFVPNATTRSCTYFLLTGSDDLAVRILAVHGWDRTMFTDENRIKFQLFSFTPGGGAGVWGPIRRSLELPEDFCLLMDDCRTAVFHEVVHWIGAPESDDWQFTFTWTVALDPHTGRTWITELPEKTYPDNASSTILATTGDGRLSLIRSMASHQIRVWVLNSGGQWSLQQTVDLQKQLPHCLLPTLTTTKQCHLNAFCPRSGCVVARLDDQEIRIDLESGRCPPHVECIGKREPGPYQPYEMDWSTYISKMKLF